jgi:hypothetical protein
LFIGSKRGVVSIGKTRFLTFLYAGQSVSRIMAVLKPLITSGSVSLNKVSIFFYIPHHCHIIERFPCLQTSSVYWLRDCDIVYKFENELL